MKPIMSEAAIDYTIRCLFAIANPLYSVEYDVNVADNSYNRSVIVNLHGSFKQLVFILAPDSDWTALVEQKYKLIWVDNHASTKKIPMLFWGMENKPVYFVSEDNNQVIVYGDILSSAFFMLSRWEETLGQPLDEHQRYQYSNSAASKYGFISIPIVDEYALLLRKILSLLLPEEPLGKRQFQVKLSHDIDSLQRFTDLKTTIRTFGGDALKTKSLSLLFKSIKEYRQTRKNPKNDPYHLAISRLAKLSEDHGFISAFYFKTSEKSDYDSGDDLWFAKEIIDELVIRGHEVGFHPGYYTLYDSQRFRSEKAALDEISGGIPYGGRQHYLRFDIHATPHHWADANLLYDSTLGYAEHEGFRCGTCHPYKLYDLSNDCELNIVEYPLIIMDGTLKSYRGLSTEEGLEVIKSLAKSCKDVEGIFTLLWHNTAILRGWIPWFEQVYKPSLSFLKDLEFESS